MDLISIGIDTGGTFTDGFFVRGDSIVMAKVETTPHDLGICLFECLREGSERLGYSAIDEMLRNTEIIRFSTTIGTNQLIEKKGPKLAVIVTKGNGKNLYTSGGASPLSGYLVENDMVWEVEESAGSDGKVVSSPAVDAVKAIVKKALLNGAREVIVSFASAVHTPANERSVKNAIHEDFPLHYLGYVPVLLSSEVSSSSDLDKRTNTTVVNAYIHQGLGRDLYRVEDQLRNSGLTRPLLIGHSDGGVARVAKTRAIDTYNSGPAAGIYGSSFMAHDYSLKNVLTMDVGGTSTDIGILSDGRVTYDEKSEISSIPVDLPLLKIDTFGAGGGSIARTDGKGLSVGPESAGSIPGPACFGLGGEEPTVTDAYVMLGMVDPDYFLGGRKKIARDEAEKAIKERVASSLGIGVEDAALKIIDAMESNVARKATALLGDAGLKAGEVNLFAFGGAGGMHGCSVADRLGCRKVYNFRHNPVFCAFGLTTLEIAHRYDRRGNIALRTGKEGAQSLEKLNALVAGLVKRAMRDIRGEGFPQSIVPAFTVDLNVKGSGPVSTLQFQKTEFTIEDIDGIAKSAGKSGDGSTMVESVRLRAKAPVRTFVQPDIELKKTEPKPSSRRDAYLGGKKVSAAVYRSEELKPGAVVRGPAILEGEFTNALVLDGWKYEVDRHLNGVMERI